MYYRVKQFRETYKSMFVIDYDINLAVLKERRRVEDCGKPGPRLFEKPIFVETQEIECISLGAKTRSSDIIKEESK